MTTPLPAPPALYDIELRFRDGPSHAWSLRVASTQGQSTAWAIGAALRPLLREGVTLQCILHRPSRFTPAESQP